MPDVTLHGTYVAICDWHGRVVWISGDDAMTKPGDLAWQHLADEFRDSTKTALARVVSLREEATLEIRNTRGEHFRTWMWPLGSPETAVCVLSVAVPKELGLLTTREREVLGLLAQGHVTQSIATELDVSASTIHTHLRRARKKLALPSAEALTGFAARYCHPTATPTIGIRNRPAVDSKG